MATRRGWVLLAVCWWVGSSGCAGDGGTGDGPPVLAMGKATCAACGMAVNDPRFAAAARTADGAVLAYDAIECLVGDLRSRRGVDAPAAVWLPDLESATLVAAAVATVVLADFPSPMGGGYAAFRDSARAESEAVRRGGVAGDLSGFVDGTRRRPAKRP